MQLTPINRREALARLALVMGGAFIGSAAYLRGEPLTGKTVLGHFIAADLVLLDEIGDTIIPTTNTPGAKATGIGNFMAMMVQDCYDDAHHTAFLSGIVAVNTASRTRFGYDFIVAGPKERTALLNDVDAEQRRHNAQKREDEPVHYFRMMKQLTLLGFFTSEIGATQALQFTEVPGKYDGNAPYQKGDRDWFTSPSRYL